MAILSFDRKIILHSWIVIVFTILIVTWTLSQDYLGLPPRWIWQVRLPRLASGFLAGGSLALSGIILQTIFNNKLADPYLIGVSSSAGVFAVGTMMFFSSASMYLVSANSLIGSAVGACILSFIAFYKRAGMSKVLMTGVVLGLFGNGLISMIYSVHEPHRAGLISAWFFGDLGRPDLSVIWLWLGVYLILFSLIYYGARQLDALAMGDEVAIGYGIRLKSVRVKWLILAVFLIALQVAFTGMIGFVGMLVPFFLQRFYGARHDRLIRLSVVFGGSILVVLDTVGNRLFYPHAVPIGVLTSVLGAPLIAIALFKFNPKDGYES